ncbi:MAG: circadian clock protein KaiB [Deltaproteobacteria bacterium]|nr:circadian clock protein KaiB [Deltaproteobacteria bacterium]
MTEAEDVASRAYPRGDKPWELRIYVTGPCSPKCLAASRNLARICDEQLQGHCRVELIDLLQSPERARSDQITAIPTVMRVFPLPVRKLVGTLDNKECALAGLDLPFD